MGMIPLIALWLPILVSAVIVFFASFIMHMVLGYHKSDYRKLPDEDRVTDAMRTAGVARGPAEVSGGSQARSASCLALVLISA